MTIRSSSTPRPSEESGNRIPKIGASQSSRIEIYSSSKMEKWLDAA